MIFLWTMAPTRTLIYAPTLIPTNTTILIHMTTDLEIDEVILGTRCLFCCLLLLVCWFFCHCDEFIFLKSSHLGAWGKFSMISIIIFSTHSTDTDTIYTCTLTYMNASAHTIYSYNDSSRDWQSYHKCFTDDKHITYD